jgi:hypothetical protein
MNLQETLLNPPAIIRQAEDLVQLAAEINREHQRCEESAQAAVPHARQAGELLLRAKTSVPRGQWLPWMKAHCSFSERTAQNYMRVAREWEGLTGDNPQRVADLPLRDVLRLLHDEPPSNQDLVASACPHYAEVDRLLTELETLAREHLEAIGEPDSTVADLQVKALCAGELRDRALALARQVIARLRQNLEAAQDIPALLTVREGAFAYAFRFQVNDLRIAWIVGGSLKLKEEAQRRLKELSAAV